jgi:ectoine hydroxylase-related dioxygenase (phytanoyl-CoA dioxygenase family)
VTELSQSIEEKGFAIVTSCLTEQMLNQLCAHLGDDKHAQRNLLCVPMVRELAVSKAVKPLIDGLFGKESFAVRGILFNKTPDANWKVVWHQDRTIAVRERKDVADFGPWSIKAGVQHVQPPASFMSKMIAIRLHLDESGENNGPLRLIPRSHRAGYLSSAEIDTWRETPSVTCTVPRGGAILMRPLLLHASSSSLRLEPRRVIHLEFAADDLPGGLEWHDRV